MSSFQAYNPLFNFPPRLRVAASAEQGKGEKYTFIIG